MPRLSLSTEMKISVACLVIRIKYHLPLMCPNSNSLQTVSSTLSTANRRFWEMMLSVRSLMCTRNSHRTDPCGTQAASFFQLESVPFMTTR